MKPTTAIITVLLLALLASCGGGEADRRMDLADSLMEENPDSAYAILQAIDSAEISGDSRRARHALLTTQARVKTDRLDLSDTAALPLLDYYTDHGSDFDRMRAAFYKAWFYYQNGSYLKAIHKLSLAHEFAERLNNYYWLAKIFDLKADMYNLNGIHDEAIESRVKTIDFYRKADRSLNADYAVCDLSMDYKNSGNPDKSLRILNHLIAGHNGLDNLEINLRCYALHHLTAIYYSLSDYRNADSCQQLLDSLSGDSYDSFGACKMRAFIAARLNKPTADSLLNVYRSILDNGSDSALYYDMMRKLAYSRGNLELANKLADSMMHYQNSEVSRVIAQSLPREEVRIQIGKTELSSKRVNRLLIYITMLVLVIIIGIIGYRIRISLLQKKKDKEIQAVKDMLLQQYMYRLENPVDTSESSDRPDNQTFLLYRDYVRRLLKICYHYDKSLSRNSKNTEHEKIIGILKRIVSDKELQSMRTSVNDAYDGILDRLEELYGVQYDENSSTIILLLAGFNPPIISLVLNENVNTIYSRKNRLIARLRNLNLPTAKLCISAIS